MKELSPIESYHYIINHHARITHEKLPPCIQRLTTTEDLEQEGWVVFVKACENFDESHGVRFETFLTTYLKYKFIRYLACVYAKSHLPLGDPVLLDNWTDLEPHQSQAFNYIDPQYEAIEFQSSLAKAKTQVSEQAQEFITLLEIEELTGLKKQEIAELVGVSTWKLKQLSGQILKALYAKPMLNGWRLEA